MFDGLLVPAMRLSVYNVVPAPRSTAAAENGRKNSPDSAMDAVLILRIVTVIDRHYRTSCWKYPV